MFEMVILVSAANVVLSEARLCFIVKPLSVHTSLYNNVL